MGRRWNCRRLVGGGRRCQEEWNRTIRLSSQETKLRAAKVNFRLQTNLVFSLAYKLLACVVLQYLNGATIYVWKSRRDELFIGGVSEAVDLTELL